MDFGPPSFSMFRHILLGAVVLLMASSCTQGSAEGGEAFDNPSRAVETQSATDDGSPGQDPDHWDPRYAEQVLGEIEELRMSVRGDVLSNAAFTKRDQHRLEAVFANPALRFQVDEYRLNVVSAQSKFVENIKPSKFNVDEVVEAHDDCIWVKAQFVDDHNRVEPLPSPTYVDVVLAKMPHDTSLNGTPWLIAQFAPETPQVVDSCYDRTDTVDFSKAEKVYVP